MSNDSQMTIHI